MGPGQGRMSCSCTACVVGCSTSPGWFEPEEIRRAADYLALPLEAFAHLYLARTRIGGVELFAPRKVTDEIGCHLTPVDYMNRPARCVFLTDDSRCRIHHAKPRECAESYSCRPTPSGLRDSIIEAWSGAQRPSAGGAVAD